MTKIVEEIPIDSYVSIGLLITNTVLLIITCGSLVITFFSMKHSKQQLLANDAPRILIRYKKMNFRKEYQSISVEVANLGNGVCLDAMCLLRLPTSQGIEDKCWMSKPSREILPNGKYIFYFFQIEDTEDIFLNTLEYELKVIYKDFFGRVYQSGDNLMTSNDDSSIKRLADEGKQLTVKQNKQIEEWKNKAIAQNNFHTEETGLKMRIKGFDAGQRDNRYNKTSESEDEN